jgi:hypothetical protein
LRAFLHGLIFICPKMADTPVYYLEHGENDEQ